LGGPAKCTGAELIGQAARQARKPRLTVAKSHFDLLRVHVDVDIVGRQVQVNGANGETPRWKHAPVRKGHRAGDSDVFDRSMINEHV